ncbi:MAG: type II toxin-antitoxin system VapC family toxin [Candidatus Auribacterota bacterium]|nr:type II toxin-antitoxin system VapC family toxin [Candidatus Auribacterota bacterium]
MGLLIDSNIFIDLERSKADLSDYIKGRDDEEIFISIISASELLHGVHRANTARIRAKRLAFVEAILRSLPILDLDLAIARSHAQLWSDLESQGLMIGVHDSWLAASCIAHDLTLITGNLREFNRVPGLTVENWGNNRETR